MPSLRCLSVPEITMPSPSFTRDEFRAGLARLGERDVQRLLQGGALDGDEARWAAEWLAGDRTLEPAAPAAADSAYEGLKLAS
jgi:hypothetical protein